MKFTKLKLEHRPLLEEWFSRNDSMMSHNDFATVYAWDVQDLTTFSTDNDVLTIRNIFKGETVYFYPIVKGGGCAVETIRAIRAYEGERPFAITSVPAECAKAIEGLDGYALPEFDRDNSDYVYRTRDLIGLEGKKYHSKRNFFHRFEQNYPYEFRDYRPSDFDAVVGLYDTWRGDRKEADFERAAILRVLPHMDQLGMRCGLIFSEGVLVAFGIVSVSRRGIGQVHFEKAREGYEGAFAAINRLCAQAYLSETEWINRQEDMGLEGLRKAKLSYHPAILLEKYRLRSV